MADAAQPLFAPNPAQMTEHVEHLFGGYLEGLHDGLIELAWTDPTTHALRFGEMFGTDRIAELVAKAVNLNTQLGCNVYIGAALRKPETPPFARASDEDFFALTSAYADLDDVGAATAAKDKYGTTKPTKVVVTGNQPHTRAQLWWRLEEPITDPRLSEGLLRGIAAGLDGDQTVVNPSRVMRLAGSIAWPVKDGRVTEATQLVTPSVPPLPPSAYAWEHLARRFPAPQPARNEEGIVLPGQTGIAGADGVTRKTTLFGFDGAVVDGREAYMLSTITACLVQLLCETGAVPTAQALFDLAWPQFSHPLSCDISKPRANGQPWTPEAFAQKVNHTLRRFAEGKIRGARTLDEAKTTHARKQAEYEARGGKGRYTDFDPGAFKTAGQTGQAGLYEALTIRQIKAMPDPKWLVDGLIIERSLGFIYGPPGCLKTFIALDMALSITTRQPNWWNRDIHRHGMVIYISSEGQANLKFRIMAWEQHHGVTADDAPFRLIRQGINFMKLEDVQKLLATVKDAAAGGPVAAVFVDTVSRVLPGAEENLQKDMTIFVAACDAVREAFDCVVVGLHHTNKGGTFRGSSVMPGAGDFMIEVRREAGAMEGIIHAEKIKDAEDGWDLNFRVTKVDVPSGLTAQTSLVLDPTDAPPSGDGLPTKDVCRAILAELDAQWAKGKPWCFGRTSPRCAETNISRKWNIERKTVTRLLEYWHANGVIAEEEIDARNHVKGFRKLLEI